MLWLSSLSEWGWYDLKDEEGASTGNYPPPGSPGWFFTQGQGQNLPAQRAGAVVAAAILAQCEGVGHQDHREGTGLRMGDLRTRWGWEIGELASQEGVEVLRKGREYHA